MAKFIHQDLQIPSPDWDAPIIGSILELSRLRDKQLSMYSVDIFMELKWIFQDLENWASARIEGNQTQLIDALTQNDEVEAKVAETTDYQELKNLNRATRFIDEYLSDPKNKLTEQFLLEIHRKVVEGLPVGDNMPGDATPGKTRLKDVKISKSKHIPPLGVKVKDYFKELIDFINEGHDTKNDFLKVAIAHHRFTWVHPFTNGNGRLARLLTYAMLQKLGYEVQRAHILNPSLVFYSDRQRYYNNLALADNGEAIGVLSWCTYFVDGLLDEINKIDRLLDEKYVTNSILLPTLKKASDANRLSDEEYLILRYSLTTSDKTFVSGDINKALKADLPPYKRARIVARMKKAGLIQDAIGSTQRYVIKLNSSLLVRYAIDVFIEAGFIKVPHTKD
jgi:Fic family protein